jgi:hypothetical protein
MTSLAERLLALEKKLMDPEVRRGDATAELISEDFIEFGGSGQIYNKRDAIAMMRHHAPRIFALENFEVRELAPNVVLATYKVQSQSADGSAGRISMRSSIWVNTGGQWQVTFHQATMVG